ncbi:MAG TPA: GNAT family N-acetyltransferase [Rhizomicrobium sp.]|nr:GNAT family N-acetyltransferase [Rhizomicrobium sp.]
MSNFVLRAATPDDAPLILEMIRELAIYEKVPENDFRLTHDTVLRDMFGAACHCDLAFLGQDAAGIVTWFWTYKSFRGRRGLYVEDLYVKPQFRGQGLGRRFLADLAARARAAGGHMEWRVLDWNAPAIAFYQSLGAKLVPEWVDCRLEDEALETLAS